MKRKTLLLFALGCGVILLTLSIIGFFWPFSAGDSYDSQLSFLKSHSQRQEAHIPDLFLFGMGNRQKLIYKDYTLKSIHDKQVIGSWASHAAYDEIMPDEYAIRIVMQDGTVVRIYEDENGVWIQHGNHPPSLVNGTDSHIRLPDFNGFTYGKILKVLHHEILINIRDGAVYPNIFVYDHPWYRDGSMAAMCLEHTGNLDLIRPWILSIKECYDMQNGMAEQDNLGQLLYLLSLFPGETDETFHHSLMEEIKSAAVDTGGGYKLAGLTDGGLNAQYQTDFLRYAVLRSNNSIMPIANQLPDPGAYKDLAWFSPGWKGKRNRMGIRSLLASFLKRKEFPFPYLDWARAHFYRDWKEVPMLSSRYPLSWESYASKADYRGMSLIDERAAQEKMAYPHAWAAAEMFLYLYEFREEAGKKKE